MDKICGEGIWYNAAQSYQCPVAKKRGTFNGVIG
jgi:hypothetical protein